MSPNSPADQEAKRRELAELQARAAALEAELRAAPEERWKPSGFYAAYYAKAGFMLGMFAAAASLLFNVVGASLMDLHPLELIRVYLTFPLGEKALADPKMGTGIVLAIGCCLYLATGMLLGVPFHLALVRLAGRDSFVKRLLLASGMAVVIWVVAYYAVLSWLQDVLFGGSWIVERIPWWVAALTHLVFGWTMALLYPLGLYQPYWKQEQA